MCRCDYGICKEDCSCRCHVYGSNERAAKFERRVIELEDELKLINRAWVEALHQNDIVDMIDAEGENMKAILPMVQEALKRLRSKPA